MKAILFSIAVVACCVIAARGEAYGNYGGGLGYKGSQYLQKGHINQYSTGGYAKGYMYSGYSGYKPAMKKEVVVRQPYAVPLFVPPPIPTDSGSIFNGDGTGLLFLLLLASMILLN